MRLSYLLFVLAMYGFPSYSFAQLSAPRLMVDGSGVPELARIADLDADGILDYVYLATHAGRIGWLPGQGDGTFGTPQLVYPGPDSLHSLALADLDGNGFIDFLAYNQVSEQVFWIPNQGEGNFAEPIDLFPSAIAELMKPLYPLLLPADVDEDGDQDIVALTKPPGSFVALYWWENDGNGQFTMSHLIDQQSLSGPEELAWEDVDLDGRPDLLARYNNMFSTDLVWYPHQGGVTFGPEQVITADNLTAPIAEFTFADLNGDGDSDIVAISSQGSRALINEGGGNFAPAYTVQNHSSVIGNTAAGDFDLDGDIDLAFMGFDFIPGNITNRLIVVWNDGTGVFETEILPEVVNEYLLPLGTADLNGDGRPDIVGLGINAVWFDNLGDGDFSTMQPIHPEILDPGNLAVADFDGDGWQDIAVLSEKSYQIAWYPNEGSAGFGSRQLLTNKIDRPTGLSAGDLDADGDDDILIGSFFSSEISWLENDGNGQFAEPQLIETSGPLLFYNGVEVATADFNDDGKVDILAYQGFQPQAEMGWLENLGGVAFAPIVKFCQSCSYWDTQDADNDGDPDLLIYATVFGEGQLKWLLNDGAGNFSEERIVATDIPYRRAVSASLVASEQATVLVQWNAPGAGVVAYRYDGADYLADTLLTEPVTWLGTIDLDNDGRFDLLIRRNDGAIAWLMNEGDLNFSAPLFLGNVDFTTAQFTDLLNNGVPDLLFTEHLPGNRIGWLENLGAVYATALCFWDENENGIQDPTEIGLRGLPVVLSPGGRVAYTDSLGIARIYAAPGDYELGFLPDTCWELTTSPASYSVDLSQSLTEPLRFGFRTDGEQAVRATITSAPTRCGFTVPFWIDLHNTGCLYAEGRFVLPLDAGLLTYISAVPAPSATSGDTLFWDFGPLAPGEIRQLRLTNEVAGVAFLGDTIDLKGYTYLTDNNGQELLVDSTRFLSEINCAYDPNDKLVDQNTILFPAEAGTTLQYTIRFQNTGTDTAFTVRLLDTLHAALDWSSFRPLGSSHPYEASLDTMSGIVEFVFRNILLPDSTTNEPASHGFVSFQVQLNADLPEGQGITNRAGIYFDFNPPILTNMVESLLESPVSVSHRSLTDPLEVQLYPNPSEGQVWITLEQALPEAAQLSVLTANGQSLFSTTLARGIRRYPIELDQWPAGIYFVRIRLAGGVSWFGRVVKHMD